MSGPSVFFIFPFCPRPNRALFKFGLSQIKFKNEWIKRTCTDACFSQRSDWCGLQVVKSLILAARYAANWGVNNCIQSSEISTAALWSARSYWNGSISRYQWLCLISSRAFRHEQAATAAAVQSNADMLRNQAFGILILKGVSSFKLFFFFFTNVFYLLPSKCQILHYMSCFSSIIAAFLLANIRNHQFERSDYFDFNEKKDIKINLFLYCGIRFGSICI